MDAKLMAISLEPFQSGDKKQAMLSMFFEYVTREWRKDKAPGT